MKVIEGKALSPGIAVGPAHLMVRSILEPEERSISENEIDREYSRFLAAVSVIKNDLIRLKERTAEEIGHGEAAIFEAHMMVLEDPLLHLEVSKKLRSERLNVEAVLAHVASDLTESFLSMNDPVLRERAADVADVGERLIRYLTGAVIAELDISEPCILAAHEISPSIAATLDSEIIQALIVEVGSPTSHTSILARALGMPAVVVKPGEVDELAEGQQLIVDGLRGTVYIDPDEATLREFEKKSSALLNLEIALRKRTTLDAITSDGLLVHVAANLEIPSEINVARENGAYGVGLYRTEFLFMNKRDLPDEEEQYRHYRVVAEAFPEQPVTIRTIDIGGDKFVSEADIPKEMNPYLGLRAIRFSLQHPELLMIQLRAFMRASRHGRLKIMFPMIACLEEVSGALEYVSQCASEIGVDEDEIDVGIMIETPSAALVADTFAKYLDFFSIGTNDLLQYTMAAERGHESLAYLQESTHPAIIRTLENVSKVALDKGIDLSICGEMAAELRLIPILLGMGITNLSMNPRAIPAAKEMIRRVSVKDCEAAIADIKDCMYSADVGRIIDSRFGATVKELGTAREHMAPGS